MMKTMTTQKKLVTMAMLAGLSIVLMYLVRVPFPGAPFLEYDPADVPILIGTFLFGPVSGLVLTAVVSVIQGLTVSSGSGLIGILMHFIATGMFVIVAGLIYRWMQSRKGAVIGLVFGSLAMTGIMIPLNLIFTVQFLGVPTEAVVAMILPVIIPFNLAKAGINSVVTFFVYKPVSKIMKLEDKKGGLVREERQGL